MSTSKQGSDMRIEFLKNEPPRPRPVWVGAGVYGARATDSPGLSLQPDVSSESAQGRAGQSSALAVAAERHRCIGIGCGDTCRIATMARWLAC